MYKAQPKGFDNGFGLSHLLHFWRNEKFRFPHLAQFQSPATRFFIAKGYLISSCMFNGFFKLFINPGWVKCLGVCIMNSFLWGFEVDKGLLGSFEVLACGEYKWKTIKFCLTQEKIMLGRFQSI